MNSKETKYISDITLEYVKFIKQTSVAIHEVKRATVLALKQLLNLKDGDIVLINEDGSIEVEEKTMAEEKKEVGKLTLNGREVTSEELQRQSEAIKNQKGAKLEEVSKGNFRLRLNG